MANGTGSQGNQQGQQGSRKWKKGGGNPPKFEDYKFIVQISMAGPTKFLVTVRWFEQKTPKNNEKVTLRFALSSGQPVGTWKQELTIGGSGNAGEADAIYELSAVPVLLGLQVTHIFASTTTGREAKEQLPDALKNHLSGQAVAQPQTPGAPLLAAPLTEFKIISPKETEICGDNSATFTFQHPKGGNLLPIVITGVNCVNTIKDKDGKKLDSKVRRYELKPDPSGFTVVTVAPHSPCRGNIVKLEYGSTVYERIISPSS